MKLRNRAQSGYYKEYVKHSNDDLTIKQIWEATGKCGSLSNAYYVIKANGLPYKQGQAGRKFKHLENLKQLDTGSMTIKQIMGTLGLTKMGDYYTILDTLNHNGLPYKKARFLTKHEAQLRAMDTANMTVKEIAEAIGFTQEWKIKKLYLILDRLGLTHKRAK